MNAVLVRRSCGLLLLGAALAQHAQAQPPQAPAAGQAFHAPGPAQAPHDDSLAPKSYVGIAQWGERSDASPGNYYLAQGQKAFSRGQYALAREKFLSAASWGQKIAQYNLGLMSFKGVGAPVDRIEGRAWLSLAAERGDDPLVAAREWADVQLTGAQRTQANVRLEGLVLKYGDAAVLPRAMERFASVTGSHDGPYHALAATDLVALEK